MSDPRYDLDCEHLKIVLEPPSLVRGGDVGCEGVL